MNFGTPLFLMIFLPAVLLLRVVIRNKKINDIVLTAVSLLFCAWGGLRSLIWLAASAVVNYCAVAVIIRLKSAGKDKKTAVRIIAAADTVINIAGLVWLKYSGNLPLGMSFYTYTALSALFDSVNGDITERPGVFDFLMYISFFPKLASGPVVRYGDFTGGRKNFPDGSDLFDGFRRFIWGLSKKMLIADALLGTVSAVFGCDWRTLPAGAAWLGAFCYFIEIYFDFSGYSDMALGLGKMFGFSLPENFDSPYMATSLRDFWRRWHITLSGWFKRYVYIPLGGSRKGKTRTVINRIIIFLLTGIWHGAGWQFAVWGLFHGILTAAEGILDKSDGKKLPVLRRILTCFTVMTGFVIFRGSTLSEGFGVIRAMFSFGGPAGTAAVIPVTPYLVFILAVAAVIVWVMPLFRTKAEKSKAAAAVSSVLCVILLALCIFEMCAGTYSPFIYQSF